MDEYQRGNLTTDQLFDEYVKVGSAHCYKVRAYRELLEFARQHSNLIKLHAGFMPQNFISCLEQQGEEAALSMARQYDLIPGDVTQLKWNDLHYQMYEASLGQMSDYNT